MCKTRFNQAPPRSHSTGQRIGKARLEEAQIFRNLIVHVQIAMIKGKWKSLEKLENNLSRIAINIYKIVGSHLILK